MIARNPVMDRPDPTADTEFFWPSGRTFKEWALIGRRDQDTWRALLAEARAHAR
jgi:hypothetical protein